MTDHDTLARIASIALVLVLIATPGAAAGGDGPTADLDGPAALDRAGPVDGPATLDAAAVEDVVTPSATEPALLVALGSDGDARVTLRLTYDLKSDAERTAFRSLRNDSDGRATVRDRFGDRMAAVAAVAENATGREMTVGNAAIALEITDDVGVATVAVTWTAFAAIEDGRLVVTEPFASGYESDRPMVVALPDGYGVDSVAPAADVHDDSRLAWSAETDFEGFRLVASTETGTTTGQGDPDGLPVPGFGLLPALLALLGTVLVLTRT